MTEIGFYHLTRTSVEEALPALLGRTLDQGKRAHILCADAGRTKFLDDALWRAKDPVWLPHGTPASGDAEFQPVWISDADDALNGATYLFVVDGRSAPHPEQYERIFDLFDGSNEEALGAARRRWSALKASGQALTYWRQEARGWHKGG